MSAPSGMPSIPFEVRGPAGSAPLEDGRLPYRRLARQYHPDANPHDPLALERFTALRRAYDRLKVFYQTRDEAGSATRPAPRPADPHTPGAASTPARTAAPQVPPTVPAPPRQADATPDSA